MAPSVVSAFLAYVHPHARALLHDSYYSQIHDGVAISVGPLNLAWGIGLEDEKDRAVEWSKTPRQTGPQSNEHPGNRLRLHPFAPITPPHATLVPFRSNFPRTPLAPFPSYLRVPTHCIGCHCVTAQNGESQESAALPGVNTCLLFFSP